jgi:hypothetical protein
VSLFSIDDNNFIWFPFLIVVLSLSFSFSSGANSGFSFIGGGGNPSGMNTGSSNISRMGGGAPGGPNNNRNNANQSDSFNFVSDTIKENLSSKK